MAVSLLDSLASSPIGRTSSALNAIRETLRQATAADTKFLKAALYYFELRAPLSVLTAPFIFPLALPPQSVTLSEPFTLVRGDGARGGLFVEESGITARNLTISGQTGFAPRKLPSAVGNVATGLPRPDRSSHARTITREGSLLVALSGQRHFQLLQDCIFRAYADLKQDPSTAEETELYFHSVKDDEHWRIFPENFKQTQTESSPLTYHYDIEALAVAPGDFVSLAFQSEDAEVLSVFGDQLRAIRSATADIQSIVVDFAEVSGTIERDIRGWATILNTATNIVDAADRYVLGLQDVINLPLATVASAFALVESTLAVLNDTIELGVVAIRMPERALRIVQNGLRRLADGYATLLTYPDAYVTTSESTIRAFNSFVDWNSGSASTLAAAAAAPPTSSAALSAVSVLPSEQLRAQYALALGRDVPTYASARELRLSSGDSLHSLAARYLGDSRLWKHIAVLNDLVPPYLSPARRPRTLWVGDVILIPSTAPSARGRALPTTLGAKLDAPAAEQLLGVDFELTSRGGSRPGWSVSASRRDARRVRGVDNLVQGLHTRLGIDRGSCTLYSRLGVDRIVGTGARALDIENAQFRMSRAVAEDPRVAGVRQVFVTQGASGDTLDVDFVADVRGLGRSVKVNTKV